MDRLSDLLNNPNLTQNLEHIAQKLDINPERAEKIYGTGAEDRIREYMAQMRQGTLL